jgi:adenosylcobinamide kinase / adenosylcobinamide-phosphate guanylyltransferase
MPKQLTLILGGARSGKSGFAERLARERGGSVLVVATATAGDAEMARRIAAHRAARPAAWRTLEAPVAVAERLAAAEPADTIVLDCLTLLVSNLLLAHEAAGAVAGEAAVQARVEAELDQLWAGFAAGEATWLVVSNEVGLGLVPPYPLGRRYRDLLGLANQRLAARADRVYLMVAGLPLALKAPDR